MHDAEQDENISDHDGGEEFEKIFYPQIHNPKSPEINRSKIGICSCDQADGVERRDCQRGEKEKPWHIAAVFDTKAFTQSAKENCNPEKQSNGQENLPEAAKVEVF